MTIATAQAIMLKLFRDEPFHNLYQYYKLPLPHHRAHDGGTCSMKTLSAKQSLQNCHGIITRLHSGSVHFLGKTYDHRLLRLIIQGKSYFADIGNGWPAIKLFPSYKPIQFNSYGILFRSKLFNNHLKIYQTRDKKTSHVATIPLAIKPEFTVLKEIRQHAHENRAPDGRLRFAQIIRNKFLFLRGDQLYVYTKANKTTECIRHHGGAESILAQAFDFDLKKFLRDNHAN